VFELAREYPQRLTKPLVNLQMSANMKYIVTCANGSRKFAFAMLFVDNQYL